MTVGEILILIAGFSLVLLVFITGKEKFAKKYPAIEYLLKEKSREKKVIKKVRGVGNSPIERYIRKAKDVGWDVRPYEVVGISIVGLVMGVGFGMFMGNEILAVGGLSLGYLFPQYILNTMAEKKKAAISMQLESAMNTISSSFDVHGNVLDTLKASIPLMDLPVKDEFQRVVQEVESGVSLEDALAGMEKRVGKKELVMFNRVTVIAENAGGKAGNVLQKCAKLVAENRLLKSDLEAEMAQVKQDTRIMFVLTIVFLVFFRITNSELFAFYKKSHGKVLMLVLLGLGMFIVYIAGKAARPKELN